ncbi:Protein SRAB-14 a [Aphelenchoides avenae]|nr:Protein SRAB-14 a [Aphelenchus avenae]
MDPAQTNLTALLCIQADYVHASWEVNVVFLFLLVINSTAISLTLHILRLLLTTQVFHVHLRILFANVSFGITARNTLTSIRALRNIIDSIAPHSSCALLKNENACRIQTTMNIVPLDAAMYTFICVAIERLLAIAFYEKYEKMRHPTLACFGAAICWVYPLLTFYETITTYATKTTQYVPYCSSITAHSVSLTMLYSFYAPILSFCFICTLLAWLLSRHKRREFGMRAANHNLSGRYQLVENIKATRLVIPIIVTYTMTIFLNIGILAAISYSNISDYKVFAVCKELSSFSIPIYANIYGIIFITQSEAIREKTFVCQKLDKFAKRKSIAPLGCTEDYFQVYQRSWK